MQAKMVDQRAQSLEYGLASATPLALLVKRLLPSQLGFQFLRRRRILQIH
jgi:hypothetical protein